VAPGVVPDKKLADMASTHLTLAWRNIWRNRRRTLITAFSIMFAVVFAVFAKSLNEGVYEEMVGNMVRFHTGYLQIQDPLYEEEPSLDNALYFDAALAQEVSQASEYIEYVIPRIETFALAAGQEQSRGTFLLGIEPELEQRLNELGDRIVEGRIFSRGDGTAVLAEGLARRLNLAVGDTVVLLGQGRFGMTAAGAFPIAGLMRHPLREMNDQLVYLSLPDAQWLFSMDDHVTNLLVAPTEMRRTDAAAADLRELLADDGLRVLTWQELSPDLVQTIEFDRVSDSIMFGVLYMIIGFGIFGTVLTMTLERRREFGMLLSIGMRRSRLGMVLLAETLLISSLGVVFGLGVGYALMHYFHANPIHLSGDSAEVIQDMGIDPVMTASLDPGILFSQAVVVFVMAFVICLYPIAKVARLNIIEAARS
jgi:putative ABC transport system permease protein